MLLSSISDFCSLNENGRRRVATTTQYTYTVTARRLIDYFQDVEVERLSSEDLLDWQEWLDDRDITTVTKNTYKRTVRAMWNYLKSRKVNVVDPKGLFQMSKEARGNKAISERNGVRMLAYSGIRETALLMLAEDSARRRGGLANLKIVDLSFFDDDETGEWGVVGRTIEKGEKPQLLLAGHESVMALKVWLHIRKKLLVQLKVHDHGFVFVNLHDGSPMTPDNMTAAVSRLRQKAGIPADQPAGLHSRRHSRAKELLKVLSLPEVRDILGHEEASTTADMYATNDEDDLVKAFFGRGRPKTK